MTVAVQPAEPTSEPSASTNATITDRSETVRRYESPRSLFPQSPFVGLQSSVSRNSLSEAGPSGTHQLPRVDGSGVSSDTLPTTERLTSRRLTATGSTQFYQQFSHLHLRRQNSIVRPPVNPVNPQPSGTSTTSAVTALARRDSRGEVEAQRGIFLGYFISPAGYNPILVLETIQGDSLSRENMEAYLSILRNYGALEK